MVGTVHVRSFLSGWVGMINSNHSDERSNDLGKGFGISVQSNPRLQYGVYFEKPQSSRDGTPIICRSSSKMHNDGHKIPDWQFFSECFFW